MISVFFLNYSIHYYVVYPFCQNSTCHALCVVLCMAWWLDAVCFATRLHVRLLLCCLRLLSVLDRKWKLLPSSSVYYLFQELLWLTQLLLRQCWYFPHRACLWGVVFTDRLMWRLRYSHWCLFTWVTAVLPFSPLVMGWRWCRTGTSQHAHQGIFEGFAEEEVDEWVQARI